MVFFSESYKFCKEKVIKESSIEGWKAYLHLLGGIPGAILLLIMGHHPCDDSYITFRHSKNFADHFLLSWNLNPPYEMGSTTPGFVFILGFLAKIFGSDNLPQIALYLNAFLLILLGSLFFRIAKDITKNIWISLGISILICMNSYNIRIYSQGFEAALFTFLFFFCIFLLHRDHFISAALLGGFAPLIRPEGVFLAPVFALFLLKRKENWKSIPYYGMIPVAYLAFSLYMYGNPIPQSIQAKKAFQFLEQGTTLENPGGLVVLVGVWNIMLKPVLLFNGEAGLKMITDLGVNLGNSFLSRGNELLISIFLLYSLIFYRLKKQKELIKLTYFSYPLFFVFFVLYVKSVAFWYLPIINSSLLLLLISGFYFLFELITNYLKRKFPRMEILPLFLTLLVIFIFAHKNTFILNRGLRKYDEMRGKIYVPAYNDSNEFERYLGYRQSAELINQFESGIALTPEVGVFGFFYHGDVIDSFGLCTRAPIDFYVSQKQKGNPSPMDGKALVSYLQPDFIVAMGFTKEFVNSSEGNNYLILRELDYKAWHSKIIIFKKKVKLTDLK